MLYNKVLNRSQRPVSRSDQEDRGLSLKTELKSLQLYHLPVGILTEISTCIQMFQIKQLMLSSKNMQKKIKEESKSMARMFQLEYQDHGLCMSH